MLLASIIAQSISPWRTASSGQRHSAMPPLPLQASKFCLTRIKCKKNSCASVIISTLLHVNFRLLRAFPSVETSIEALPLYPGHWDTLISQAPVLLPLMNCWLILRNVHVVRSPVSERSYVCGIWPQYTLLAMVYYLSAVIRQIDEVDDGGDDFTETVDFEETTAVGTASIVTAAGDQQVWSMSDWAL